MDTILPSEWPYVIGLVAIVIALFWLVRRTADRGALSGPARPAILLAAAFFFGLSGIFAAVDGRWLAATLYGCGVAIYLFTAWQRRQQN